MDTSSIELMPIRSKVAQHGRVIQTGRRLRRIVSERIVCLEGCTGLEQVAEEIKETAD